MTGAADANAIFGGEGDADVRTRGLTDRYAGAVPMRQAGGDALVEITPPLGQPSGNAPNRPDAPGRPIRRDRIQAPTSADFPF